MPPYSDVILRYTDVLSVCHTALQRDTERQDKPDRDQSKSTEVNGGHESGKKDGENRKEDSSRHTDPITAPQRPGVLHCKRRLAPRSLLHTPMIDVPRRQFGSPFRSDVCITFLPTSASSHARIVCESRRPCRAVIEGRMIWFSYIICCSCQCGALFADDLHCLMSGRYQVLLAQLNRRRRYEVHRFVNQTSAATQALSNLDCFISFPLSQRLQPLLSPCAPVIHGLLSALNYYIYQQTVTLRRSS